ncbi:GAF domain-containing protein [Kineococcus sp. T13]|uniref:GAF and ANTAR domain-containing protein n=1 Tax=Kineococcus vitellinus TaxID=2696565 RepID=UPI0014122FBE|nr:GAF and ANTAR domain-containing protein [Kineococcus vitellinus]NAZ77123.1 GAF domain-containing protein [Kineococcus vitellinus]
MLRGRPARILTAVSAAPGPDGVPPRFVRACARALPVTGVALSLTSAAGDLGGLVAACGGNAAALEDLQFDLGEGPCLDASRSREPVLVADLARDGRERWPVLAAEAPRAGIAAVFAYPLQVGPLRLGVLGLHRDRPGGLEEAVHAEALQFAAAAVALLLHLHSRLPATGAARGPVDRAGTAAAAPPAAAGIVLADDRAVVHQATGVVSASAGVSTGTALLLLRARAYAEGRGVRALAQDVVAARTWPTGRGHR